MADKYISRPEEIVLLAVWKLKEDAYGITIRKLIQEMTRKYWSIGAVYVPLERLEKKGLLTSYNSSPSPERGGRRKRLFKITSVFVLILGQGSLKFCIQTSFPSTNIHQVSPLYKTDLLSGQAFSAGG